MWCRSYASGGGCLTRNGFGGIDIGNARGSAKVTVPALNSFQAGVARGRVALHAVNQNSDSALVSQLEPDVAVVTQYHDGAGTQGPAVV